MWHIVLLIFNPGVTSSRPVWPTKLNRPPLPGSFEENQGVKVLGQPDNSIEMRWAYLMPYFSTGILSIPLLLQPLRRWP